MKSTINQLSITSLALLIAACSSTPNNESERYGKGYGDQLKGQQLYAVLSKEDSGRYAFSRFTTDRPNSDTNSAWVDLSQLDPVFSTSDSDCTTQSLVAVVGIEDESNDEICSNLELRENLFHDSTINTDDVVASTAGNALLTVITFGMGAMAAQGHYTVEFDEDTYIDALNEAKANFDIQPLLVDLNKFDTDLALRQKQLDAEIESKRASLDKAIKVSFIDKSKLYGKSPKDIVSVSIKSHQSSLKSVRNTEFKKVEDLYLKLNKKEAEVRSDVVFETDCNTRFLRGWNYSISGCGFEAGLNDKSMKNVSMTVKSKKEFYVPYLPTMSDKTVVVKAENGKLTISNKTGKYLKVDSVSMYVGNDIETRTNLNVEVPPEAVSTIADLGRFPDSERRRTLYNVDQTSLKHSIKLGAAVKYRIADTNVEKTLYKVDAVTPYRYY
ncbi:hypothetical protein [Vibrio rotiferianus]|uniref:hypothetical protein n=1 Tax=Vibrio rotiferianus TaxID=190895 RepID=UPI002490C000|nr:hypothetical protein [Vibrio rotiferianus]